MWTSSDSARKYPISQSASGKATEFKIATEADDALQQQQPHSSIQLCQYKISRASLITRPSEKVERDDFRYTKKIKIVWQSLMELTWHNIKLRKEVKVEATFIDDNKPQRGTPVK